MIGGRLRGGEAGKGSGGSQAAIGRHNRCPGLVGEFNVEGVNKSEVLSPGECAPEQWGKVVPLDGH